jgi:hypothetical protein
MRVPLMLTTAVGWSLCSGIAAAQTPAHVDAVKNAQKSAYAVVESTNGCPAADRDLFGWPRNLVLNCEYAKQDTALGRKRRAVAYLLDVKPEVIARWIEGACAQLRNEPANCFKKVLSAGQGNSGYMFAVSGNIIEDMDQPNVFKNFFFRNGMTVSMQRGLNGSGQDLSVAEQRRLALSPNDAIVSIPSGMTRFWRTSPAQFRARFPGSGAPATVDTPERRAKWLDLAQKQMLEALQRPKNRLLEAWLCATARQTFATSCKAPS